MSMVATRSPRDDLEESSRGQALTNVHRVAEVLYLYESMQPKFGSICSSREKIHHIESFWRQLTTPLDQQCDRNKYLRCIRISYVL